jgi:hypothetical protein
MSFSYSFHLSNKGNALTTVSKIGGASKHNLRLYKDTQNGNYDKSQIEILEGSDVSILDDVKKIYHEEFDEALLKYNEGKRPDRQITDYLEHVSNKKADVACELIIQVGDKDFWKDKTLEERKQMNDIFKSQIEELKRILPDFKIASAVAHYDESSPHLHVVGVPVHEGYKKGLEKQVSKRNVFTQESLKMLQDKMREHVQEQMKDKDIFKDMELKEKEKGRNKDIPKHALDDFYKLEKEIELKKGEKEQIETEISEAEPKLEELKGDIGLKQYTLSELDEQIKAKNTSRDNLDHEVEELSSKLSKSKTELKNTNDELKKAKSSVQPQMQAYKTVAEASKSHKAPTIEIGSQEVKDGFMKSHEEYFVKIPCKDVKEAQKLKKEVDSLYTKLYTNKSLNEVVNANLGHIDREREKLAKERAKLAADKAEQQEALAAEKAAAITQSELYRIIKPEHLGITVNELPSLTKTAFNDSLINETVDATIKALNDKGLLKQMTISDKLDIYPRVRRSLGDRVQDFFDKVRQTVVEKALRTFAHNHDHDRSR